MKKPRISPPRCACSDLIALSHRSVALNRQPIPPQPCPKPRPAGWPHFRADACRHCRNDRVRIGSRRRCHTSPPRPSRKLGLGRKGDHKIHPAAGLIVPFRVAGGCVSTPTPEATTGPFFRFHRPCERPGNGVVCREGLRFIAGAAIVIRRRDDGYPAA